MIMDFELFVVQQLAPRVKGKHFALSAEHWDRHHAEFDGYMKKNYADVWISSPEYEMQAEWIHAMTGNTLVRVIRDPGESMCSTPTEDGVLYMVLAEKDLEELTEIVYEVRSEMPLH